MPCKFSVLSTLILGIAAASAASPAHAQQTDIQRYELYSGYTHFSTPSLSLEENGYHLQAGYNLSRSIAMGFDYSIVMGSNTLTPNELTDSLQLQIGTSLRDLALEGLLPPGYQLAVKTDSTTQTFAAGPQAVFRRYKPITLFARPDLGAIREVATPHPTDPISVLVIQQLAPSGHKTSWDTFFGVGGGIDWNATRRFGLRVQVDEVYNHLFNDILKEDRWTTRVSIGPTIHFGGNILESKK